MQTFAIDAQDNGDHQILVNDGRRANLYAFADCRLPTLVDSHADRPFWLDLVNLASNGTEIGRTDLGDGRHLIGLQASQNADQWLARRTPLTVNGIRATIDRSDAVTAAPAQEPVVTAAKTIRRRAPHHK